MSQRFATILLRQIFLFFFLCGITGSGYAALLESPRRVVNGQAVDLTPLFHWWTNQHGARPLTGWVRVTGRIVGTNSFGWIMAGPPEKSAHRSITNAAAGQTGGEPHGYILKNPPAHEVADFQHLQEQLKQAKDEKAKLQSEAANLKAQETQVQKTTRGRLRARATGQLHSAEKADSNMIKDLDRTISQITQRLSVYPKTDHYEVNSFALYTGREYNQLRVYDRGMPLQ